MFILPAHGAAAALPQPLAHLAAHSAGPLLRSWPAALVLALALVLLVRAAVAVATFALARFRPKAVPSGPGAKEKQAQEAHPSPVPADANGHAQQGPAKGRWWNGLFRLRASLPPLSLAEALPITLHPPPPPVMRGRYVYRGGRGVGFSTRKETALAVETPVPAIYETQTPASMAKLIMSRHTYRRPTPPSLPQAPRRVRAPSIISAPPMLPPSRSPSPPSRSPSPPAEEP
ncbi:hypothetical protein MIND_00188000 [Mycena indigotica]|uniref:Uncharacterized protein n=1 Tax=Mycena indigotica TaxID=2126181 RepID=A0A8H6T6G3_9AGAR|nr:uncharacterized protein MIND_00188000 [Mycena indigotica]KAF7311775.1 hypothetical protein MIND_00188000 [Mycena indigotica]